MRCCAKHAQVVASFDALAALCAEEAGVDGVDEEGQRQPHGDGAREGKSVGSRGATTAAQVAAEAATLPAETAADGRHERRMDAVAGLCAKLSEYVRVLQEHLVEEERALLHRWLLMEPGAYRRYRSRLPFFYQVMY